MWMTVPDDFQVHMMDRDLINYATGDAGTGIVLPPSSGTPSTDPLVVATMAVLTALAKEAQIVVVGELSSQGLLSDPLPTSNVCADLLRHITTHVAFEHLFLRIPGQASEYPTAWDKSIKSAHDLLHQMRDGDIPLDPAFFSRGAESSSPPLAAVVGINQNIDAAFRKDRLLPSMRGF